MFGIEASNIIHSFREFHGRSRPISHRNKHDEKTINTIFPSHDQIRDSWYFDNLSMKEIKLGEIIKNINNLITNFPANNQPEADATMILNNIWLGNCISAHDYRFIRGKKIKYIINATDDISNKFPSNVTYINFFLHDDDACKLNFMDEINYCADIIHKAVSENSTILIHCKRGHHRSASIVAYYLMKYHNMTLMDAIYLIKSLRPTTFMRMTCMVKTLICYQNSIQ